MDETTFNSLPTRAREFVSFAPCVVEGKTSLGLLKFSSFEEWKNEVLEANYTAERKSWEEWRSPERSEEGKVLNETILYHGCPSVEGRQGIKMKGFDLKKVGSSSHNLGLFGAGIYFANTPVGAIGYSTSEHPSDAQISYSIIVSRVLVGKSLELPYGGITTAEDRERGGGIDEFLLAFPFTGIGLVDGYDSHSCNGEVCVFKESQILPLGMLHMDVVPSLNEV